MLTTRYRLANSLDSRSRNYITLKIYIENESERMIITPSSQTKRTQRPILQHTIIILTFE